MAGRIVGVDLLAVLLVATTPFCDAASRLGGEAG
jgi:hypothetical protein